MYKKMTCLLCYVVLGIAGSALGADINPSATIIQPTAVVSEEYVFNSAADTISNDRMATAVNGGDLLTAAIAAEHEFGGTYDGSYVSTDPGGYPSDFFASLPGGDTGVDIVLDLTGGGDTAVAGIVLWQYENNGGGAANVGNHARTIEIRVNTEAEGSATFAGAVTTVTLLPVTDGDEDATNDMGGVNSGQVFALSSAATGRYVQLTITDNYVDEQGITAGGDRVGFSEVRFTDLYPFVLVNASNPEPYDTESDVPLDTDLKWDNPADYNAAKFVLDFRADDPNWLDVANTTTIDPVVDLDLDGDSDTTQADVPVALVTDTTYFWRVTSYEPNAPADIPHVGPTWSFTTVPSVPVITQEPVSATVANAGDTAELSVTVDSISTPHYQWKQYVDGINDPNVGADASTLTITNFQTTDEALYYCVVSNDGAATATSEKASLVIERLVSHWKLDVAAPYADAEGTNTLTPFGDLGLPTTGVAGQIDEAVNFDSSADPNGQYLEAPYAVALNPANFTVSAWAKVDAGSTGHRAVLSVRDEAPGTEGYVLYAEPGNRWQLYAGTGTEASWSILTGGSVVEDTWMMVTATFEATGSEVNGGLTGEYILYVNGAAVSSASGDHAPNAAQGVLIGAGSNQTDPRNFFFAGDVDDVRIYSKVLTPLEVATLYTDGDPTGSVCLGGNPAMDIANADTGLVLGDQDFEGDCKVNLYDFMALANGWLECNLIPTTLCN